MNKFSIYNFQFSKNKPNTIDYRPTTNSGFTLVEALLAIAILVIGVLGVIQLFPAGLNSTKMSKEETIATHLTQAKLEEYQAASYDSVASENRARVSSDPNDQNYKYERQSIVTYINGDLTQSESDIGLKKVIVSVFWQESGTEKNVSATYLKHK